MFDYSETMQVCESVNCQPRFAHLLPVEQMIRKVWTFKSNVTMGQGFALVCWPGIGGQAPISLRPFYTCLAVASDGEGVMATT